MCLSDNYCFIEYYELQTDLELVGTLLKAEGNALFESGHYEPAVHLYTAAIHLGHHIVSRRSTDLTKQRLSTFYSNRSAGFLKLVSCWKYFTNTLFCI